MIDIAQITTNLTKDAAGIWVARNQGKVSYPPGGNQACFAVEDTSFWFRHRNDVITHLVRHQMSDDTFFDIGGGNGCVSHALQRVGIDVVLVEPGPRGAHNAIQRGVRTVIQSTLQDAGFEPGTLPSAGLFDVLEHIESDASFINTIHTYLRPQGRLYITVPAYKFLWSSDDVRAGHYRRYTTRSLTNRLKESGFDITYCSYLFSVLVLPILLFRSIPSRLGFRQSASAKTREKEHSPRTGSTGTIVRKCLDLELNRIKRWKRIPTGTSCIAVATKTA